MKARKLRIAFFELEEWQKAYFETQLREHSLVFIDEPLGGGNARRAEECDAIAVFVMSEIRKKVLDALPHLKFITSMSTGYDHIDLKECARRGITACNVPTYGENTVAEHAFALILALSRRIFESVEQTRRGDFSTKGLRGFDLKGRTLGIVGTGHIGMHVARIAKGFGMNVLASDVRPDRKMAKRLGFKYVPFDYLLKNSDIVSLHVPHNAKTHHLINKNSIMKMKRGALLINTARGGLVETDALVKALDSGLLAGAGLDVLEGECFVKEEGRVVYARRPQEGCSIRTILENHILMHRKNVIITPHNAFNSNEAVNRIMETTVGNVRAFAKGKPINVVKLQV